MPFLPVHLMSRPTIVFLLLSLLASTSCSQTTSAANKFRRHEAVGRHGVVATDDGRCSRIGMDVLRHGGHAVDAAVAAALCLGVGGAASSGIGGGAFMLIRSASGRVQAFDMRETAPMKAMKTTSSDTRIFILQSFGIHFKMLIAPQDMYGGNATIKASSPLSIAVPGELAGLHKAWKEHGKLPWERLVRPAEKLA